MNFSAATCEYLCLIETYFVYIQRLRDQYGQLEVICGLAADDCRILYLQIQIVLYLVVLVKT